MKNALLTLTLSFLAQIGFGQCAPDVTPPVITCPSDTTINNDADSCNAVFTYPAVTATDACDGLVSTTFSCTGTTQFFVVPAGITSLTIETWGAEGEGSLGGLGGYAKGDMVVSPGQVLEIRVGCQDGYNGGGAGFAAIPRNGGGATDVRTAPYALADRVIVAGGGGGGGATDVGTHAGGAGGGGTVGANYAGGGGAGGYGGAGSPGGLTGGAGNSTCHSGGAGGGGFTSGGSGSCNTCYTGTCGSNGTLGQGGAGDTWETGICYDFYGGTSGGGGGYYGGGGSSVGNCGSGGGGGGSSYTGTLTSITLTGGIWSGDGQCIITHAGSSTTVTQTAGLPSGSTFPVGTTTNTFEAEDGSGNISTCSFDVTVLDAGPNVDATTTTSGMDTITANNATATSYQWIDCGTMTNVAGETSQEFVATYNGSFAVVVTEGACSDTSACVDINGLGVESAGQHINFKMYPNPTNGNFTLEFANNVERINVEITDVAGRNVHSFSAGNMSKFTSSFNGADGLYFVKITADGKVMFTTLAVE